MTVSSLNNAQEARNAFSELHLDKVALPSRGGPAWAWAVDARFHEAPLPAPDAGLGHAARRMISIVSQPSAVARMIRARQTCVPIGQNGFQPLPITRPKPDLDVAAHARGRRIAGQDRLAADRRSLSARGT